MCTNIQVIGWGRFARVCKGIAMKLLDQVRRLMRTKHLAIRTERAYVRWIQRFLEYHRSSRGKWIHPDDMGSDEVNSFLTHLAVDGKVAALSLIHI